MFRSFKIPGKKPTGLLPSFIFGRRAQSGTAMIEFALIAPVLIAILAGIIEFSSIIFVQNLLEGGIRQASRYGIVGTAPDGSTRETAILGIIEDNTFGVIDGSKLQLETLTYQSFAAIGQSEPYDDVNGNGSYDTGESFDDINGNGQQDDDQGAVGAGGGSDIVLYTAVYDWDIMVPIFRPFFGDQVTLEASIAVRNEAFGA